MHINVICKYIYFYIMFTWPHFIFRDVHSSVDFICMLNPKLYFPLLFFFLFGYLFFILNYTNQQRLDYVFHPIFSFNFINSILIINTRVFHSIANFKILLKSLLPSLCRQHSLAISQGHRLIILEVSYIAKFILAYRYNYK